MIISTNLLILKTHTYRFYLPFFCPLCLAPLVPCSCIPVLPPLAPLAAWVSSLPAVTADDDDDDDDVPAAVSGAAAASPLELRFLFFSSSRFA